MKTKSFFTQSRFDILTALNALYRGIIFNSFAHIFRSGRNTLNFDAAIFKIAFCIARATPSPDHRYAEATLPMEKAAKN